MLSQWPRFGLSLICAALAVQCGSEGESSKVKVSSIPKNPIVITGDTVDPVGRPIAAPWFQFKVQVENQSPNPLTLVGLKVTVSLSQAGSTPVEQAFTPGLFNYTLESGETCTFVTYETINPGETTILTIEDNTQGCGTFEAVFYPSGLEKPKNSAGYRYRAKIEPLGWFGTANEQTGRFTKSVFIFTQ